MPGKCLIWNNSGGPQKYFIVCERPEVNPGDLDPDNKPQVLTTILGASGEIGDTGTAYFSPSTFYALCGAQPAEDAPFLGMKSLPVDLQDPDAKKSGSIAVVVVDHDGSPEISDSLDEPLLEFPTGHVYCNWDGKQPFFPLFCEWEAVYYHIPFEHWEIQSGASSVARDMATLRYGIRSEAEIAGITDRRVLSGRNTLLPQTCEALANDFARLLDRMAGAGEVPVDSNPAGWPSMMKELPILSTLMKGLRAHLTTQVSEMHIKPTVHAPGKHPTVLESAAAAAADIGFTVDSLSLVGDQTGLTPYGDSIEADPDHCPFKPVSHGQMVVTKLNIVDRFGQVLSAMPDQGGPKSTESALKWIYPCVGEEFKPSTKALDKTIVRLTILPEPDREKCGVLQLPPGLNQSARLNGCFVVPDSREEAAPWKPANEWDNPVWGWVVINYSDYGLQMFNADGRYAYLCHSFASPIAQY